MQTREGLNAVAELKAANPESIVSLMRELKRISDSREDIVVPHTRITMVPSTVGATVLPEIRITQSLGGEDAFAGVEIPSVYALGPVAHEQIAERMDIPWKYYQRMAAEDVNLLCTNVNRWMETAGRNYFLRTIDGRVRAFLGQRYKVMDDFDFALNVIEVIREVGAEVISATLSEKRLYLRAVKRDWTRPIIGRDGSEGDLFIPGFLGSNSSVGMGGMDISAYGLRPICMNGSAHVKVMHKIHLGTTLEEGIQASAELQRARNEALWLEVRDTVRSVFDKDFFDAWVNGIQRSVDQVLAEPIKAVEAVVKAVGITEDQQESILSYLMNPLNPATEAGTVYGLSQAITRLAHEAGAEEEARLQAEGARVIREAESLFALA